MVSFPLPSVVSIVAVTVWFHISLLFAINSSDLSQPIIFAFCAYSFPLYHSAGGGENAAGELCLVWRVLWGQELGSTIPKPGQIGRMSDGRCMTEELHHGSMEGGALAL